MKKIFFTLLLLPALICSSQKTSSYGLKEADSQMMNVQIQMPIKITKNNALIAEADTSTHIIVENITLGCNMKSNISELILMLQPNMEYKIIFQKKGCNTKEVFVFTKNVSAKYRYILNTVVDLTPGSSKVSCGKVSFNVQKSDFIPNITGVKIVSAKAKPYNF